MGDSPSTVHGQMPVSDLANALEKALTAAPSALEFAPAVSATPQKVTRLVGIQTYNVPEPGRMSANGARRQTGVMLIGPRSTADARNLSQLIADTRAIRWVFDHVKVTKRGKVTGRPSIVPSHRTRCICPQCHNIDIRWNDEVHRMRLVNQRKYNRPNILCRCCLRANKQVHVKLVDMRNVLISNGHMREPDPVCDGMGDTMLQGLESAWNQNSADTLPDYSFLPRVWAVYKVRDPASGQGGAPTPHLPQDERGKALDQRQREKNGWTIRPFWVAYKSAHPGLQAFALEVMPTMQYGWVTEDDLKGVDHGMGWNRSFMTQNTRSDTRVEV